MTKEQIENKIKEIRISIKNGKGVGDKLPVEYWYGYIDALKFILREDGTSKLKVGDKVKVTVSKDDCWYKDFKEYTGVVTHIYENDTVKIDDTYYFLQPLGENYQPSKIEKV